MFGGLPQRLHLVNVTELKLSYFCNIHGSYNTQYYMLIEACIITSIKPTRVSTRNEGVKTNCREEKIGQGENCGDKRRAKAGRSVRESAKSQRK